MGQVGSGCCDRRNDEIPRRSVETSQRAHNDGVPSPVQNQSFGRKLPPDWDEVYSKSTGKIYYYNRVTGTSTWDFPIDRDIGAGGAIRQETATSSSADSVSRTSASM